jgi:hypothetical protein
MPAPMPSGCPAVRPASPASSHASNLADSASSEARTDSAPTSSIAPEADDDFVVLEPLPVPRLAPTVAQRAAALPLPMWGAIPGALRPHTLVLASLQVRVDDGQAIAELHAVVHAAGQTLSDAGLRTFWSRLASTPDGTMATGLPTLEQMGIPERTCEALTRHLRRIQLIAQPQHETCGGLFELAQRLLCARPPAQSAAELHGAALARQAQLWGAKRRSSALQDAPSTAAGDKQGKARKAPMASTQAGAEAQVQQRILQGLLTALIGALQDEGAQSLFVPTPPSLAARVRQGTYGMLRRAGGSVAEACANVVREQRFAAATR